MIAVREAPMDNIFFRLVLPLVALVVGGYVARHAFSEGMHTVIASQPGPAAYESTRIGPSPACQMESNFQVRNPLQCQMEMRASREESLVFHAKPPQGMSKAQSETASGWFMLAALAVPLSLGAAALFAFLLFYAARTE
ncbi:MAG: hypothetical protein JOY77_05815 [Alphaproteobacteria bacterium]|nr:hypothetical protein [Alphaproteobacteria bacterium]